MAGKIDKRSKANLKTRHRFFLSPYKDIAFTKCPKCDGKTKLRKFPLVIHIEPKQIFVLNKNCRYCTGCDLIIAKRVEVEGLMANCFEKVNPEIVGNEYLIFGTVEKRDWREINKGKLSLDEIIKSVYVFKDVWNFEMIPAGWYPSDKG